MQRALRRAAPAALRAARAATEEGSSLCSTSGRELLGHSGLVVTPMATAASHVVGASRSSVATTLLVRCFASLVGSGIPSPRHDVALKLSTPHGGHINNMILTSQSILELDSVLHKFRKRLRPAALGAASMQLEHLHRMERGSPFSLKVQRVAAELEKYVDTFAERLALTQVGNVVRGMSAVRHVLPPELLVRLAAGVVAEQGAALRVAPDVDLRDLFFGFSGQGYTNPLFWSRLSSAVLPRLASLDPNTLPAMVLALHTAQQLPPAAASSSSSASSSPGPEASGAAPGSQPQAALARQALLLLTAPGVLAGLRPARLACAAHALAAAGPCPGVGVLPDERVMGELQAASMAALPHLNPSQLAGLLLSVAQLRRRALGASAATPASSVVSPHACQDQLPPELLAAALPHIRTAAPSMQLLHIKRTVEALAPLATAPAPSGTPSPTNTQQDSQQPQAESALAHTASAAPSVPEEQVAAVLEVLSRRALQVLPPVPHTQHPHAHRSASQQQRQPRAGPGAGTAHLPVLDGPTVGALDGLARAYAAVLGTGGGGAGGLVAAAEPPVGAVGELFVRIGALAEAARARGLLGEAQRGSLAASLGAVAGPEVAAPLLLEASS